MQKYIGPPLCGSQYFPYPFGAWIPYSLLSYGNQSGILRAKLRIDNIICDCDNDVFVTKILSKLGKDEINNIFLQPDEIVAVVKMTIDILPNSCGYLGIPYPDISLTTGHKLLLLDNAVRYAAGDKIHTYGIFAMKLNEYFAFKLESDDDTEPVYISGAIERI